MELNFLSHTVFSYTNTLLWASSVDITDGKKNAKLNTIILICCFNFIHSIPIILFESVLISLTCVCLCWQYSHMGARRAYHWGCGQAVACTKDYIWWNSVSTVLLFCISHQMTFYCCITSLVWPRFLNLILMFSLFKQTKHLFTYIYSGWFLKDEHIL